MKFEIRITDLDESRLKSLLKFLESRQEVKVLTERRLTKAERMRRKVSDEAPYGLKKDGMPRKKAGRPPNKYEF
jgi:hypothetical protein